MKYIRTALWLVLLYFAIIGTYENNARWIGVAFVLYVALFSSVRLNH